jgi:hypothetical protein
MARSGGHAVADVMLLRGELKLAGQSSMRCSSRCWKRSIALHLSTAPRTAGFRYKGS